jgi:putative tryptophan/tyrosine transport system substrate-binding protein
MRRRDLIAGIGSTAAWPMFVRAQQRSMPVIGYLSPGRRDGPSEYVAAFHRGLFETGYVEGRNLTVEYRWAENQFDRLQALAANLVDRQVALIVAVGSSASALAAEAATATIPIVFANGGEPIELGVVAGLNRPGGNTTGVTFLITALNPKRLQLLHEMIPAATSIGYFNNPTIPHPEVRIGPLETAARSLGVRLVIANASTPNEIEAAFAILVEQRIGALLVGGDNLFNQQGPKVVGLAAQYAVPAIYAVRRSVEAGGLLSYGAKISESYRIAGTYVGRILKGEKPSDLPVQQSTRLEMVFNLWTAKALGLTIPETLLALADEVIQ